jgi:hypothetical protein
MVDNSRVLIEPILFGFSFFFGEVSQGPYYPLAGIIRRQQTHQRQGMGNMTGSVGLKKGLWKKEKEKGNRRRKVY